jgi:hypothetical protein
MLISAVHTLRYFVISELPIPLVVLVLVCAGRRQDRRLQMWERPDEKRRKQKDNSKERPSLSIITFTITRGIDSWSSLYF